MNIFLGEGFLQQFAQRLQILLHRDVVEIALAGFAPDHQRHGSEGFAVHQHFAPGNRGSVHDLRVAGGDSSDVGRIVDDDALADRQSHILRAALGASARGRCQNQEAGATNTKNSSFRLCMVTFPWAVDAHDFHGLRGSANHDDLIRRRRRRRRSRDHCDRLRARPGRRRSVRRLLADGANSPYNSLMSRPGVFSMV